MHTCMARIINRHMTRIMYTNIKIVVDNFLMLNSSIWFVKALKYMNKKDRKALKYMNKKTTEKI